MADDGKEVIDLCSSDESPEPEIIPLPRQSQPRSQQSVPESRFITPSDDSEDDRQVFWKVRKRKSDAETNSLRATGNTIRKSPPRVKVKPSSENKKNSASGPNRKESIEVKKPPPPPQVNQTPAPDVFKNPSIHHPHIAHNNAPSSTAPSQPVRSTVRTEVHRASVPANVTMPDAKPVSILTPATQQWLAASQARSTRQPPSRTPVTPSSTFLNGLTPSSAPSHVSKPPSSSVPGQNAPKPSPFASRPPSFPAPRAHPATGLSAATKTRPNPPTVLRNIPQSGARPDSYASNKPPPQAVPARATSQLATPAQPASATISALLSAAAAPPPTSQVRENALPRIRQNAPSQVRETIPPQIKEVRRSETVVPPRAAAFASPKIRAVASSHALAATSSTAGATAPSEVVAVTSPKVTVSTSPKVTAIASPRAGRVSSSRSSVAAGPNIRTIASPKYGASASPRSSMSAAAKVGNLPSPNYAAQFRHSPHESHSRNSSADTFVTAASQSSRDSLGIPTHNEPTSKRKAHDAPIERSQSAKRLRMRTLHEHTQDRLNTSSLGLFSTEPFDQPILSVEDDMVTDGVEDKEPDGHQPRFNFPDDISQIPPFGNKHGKPFSDEEDALIVYFKETKKLQWRDLERWFPGRRWTSLQSRYSTNLSPRALQLRNGKRPIIESSAVRPPVTRQLRQQKPTFSMRDNDIVMSEGRLEDPFTSPRASSSPVSEHQPTPFKRSAPDLVSLIRHREIGATRGREWPRKLYAEMKHYAYSTLGFEAFMDSASGDVSTIAWSSDGKSFAAGAVAVTDQDSIQYNKPRNMVVGDFARSEIKELDQHRIVRPPAKDLFSTVQMVGFSPDNRHLYSVSIDKHLNVYSLNDSVSDTELVAQFDHPAAVDFLSISNHGVVATGCAHSGPESIRVVSSPYHRSSTSTYFSATNASPSAKKYPSALRWGTASCHEDYLLAAFSCEAEVLFAEDDQREKDGEVCLWDVRKGQRLETGAPNRNVFDVTWNPNPSPASSVFAVASGVVGKVNAGIHSVVRLYSPDQHRARHLIELECPAWDINDVLYSPHDENVIAVGSTDGKVYIWDIRFAKKDQLPTRTLKHGYSLSVLPHEKRRWESDTGIRFLSWGEERNRVYTGSSDGVVKCWNPYRSHHEMHVRDVAKFDSAIMSGAFSPDCSSLLIGEDQARLNLLTVGNGDKTRQDMKRFVVHEALVPEQPNTEYPLHKALVDTGRIEHRPMGTLPIRQAVQGPNYDGPYLKGLDEKRLREAAQKFQEKTLRMLQRQNKRLKKMGQSAVEQCHLDCAYKPIQTHEKDEPMEESGRAQDRIPENLGQKILPGPEARKRGLNAKCAQCGAAARIPDDKDASADVLCERCNFTCFRCGEVAEVSTRTKVLECLSCGVAWSIGVLGYYVLTDNIDHGMARAIVVQESEEEEELGDQEREFFLRDLSDDSSGELTIAGKVREVYE